MFLVIGTSWFFVSKTKQNKKSGEGQEYSKSENYPKEIFFAEDSRNNQVVALDMNGRIIKKINVGIEPHDIAASPDQRFVVTANAGNGTISIVDTKTLTLKKTIATGKGSHGVAFSPAGDFIFVANSEEDSVSVIEFETFKQSKIAVEGIPEYIGVTPDGSKIFTTNLSKDGTITIIENRGLESKVIKTVSTGFDPHGFALSPKGDKLVITNFENSFTNLWDPNTFEKLGRIDTGAATEFATFRNNEELWITNISIHEVYIIDAKENKILGKIEVGELPHGISFSRDKTLAFVPLYGGEIVIIDVAQRKVINRIKVGANLHNSVIVNLE